MTPPAIDLGLPAMIYHGTRNRPPHISVQDVVGSIPSFIDPEDERPAAQQIAANYIGGWTPVPAFSWDRLTGALIFPGDFSLYPWVASSLRDELILIYESGYVLIGQPDGSFEVDRLDWPPG